MLPNPRRPLWGEPANSHIRPQPAGQRYVSISAGGAPGNRVEWPVFGGQVDDPTAATRPRSVIRRHEICAV
ncbi:hypothetical protein KA344_20175 [bacterium]|nr:hypothetical protein [bacterium]